jgi:hypothetical protein
LPEAREVVHLAHLFEGVDGGGEVVFDQRFRLVGQEPAHDQDAGLRDAAAAQVGAFIDRADCQPVRAFRDQNACHLDGAMAVSIGFDDAGHFDARPDHRPHVAVVARDLLAGDEDVRTERGEHYFDCTEPRPLGSGGSSLDSTHRSLRQSNVGQVLSPANRPADWQAKAPAPL